MENENNIVEDEELNYYRSTSDNGCVCLTYGVQYSEENVRLVGLLMCNLDHRYNGSDKNAHKSCE